MNNPFADTLHLWVRPSATQRCVIVALHLAAVAVVAVLALSRPAFWLLVPPIIAVGVRSERAAALRTKAGIQRLRWQNDNLWRWQRRDGQWREGHLAHSFCLGDLLVVLGLRETCRRFRICHCVLFSDAVSATGHRHLRARLTVAPDPRAARDDAG